MELLQRKLEFSDSGRQDFTRHQTYVNGEPLPLGAARFQKQGNGSLTFTLLEQEPGTWIITSDSPEINSIIEETIGRSGRKFLAYNLE